MRKKVSYDELISGKRFSSYQDEVDYIMRLIGQGELEPVKSSPKNGKRPALYTRYWKIIEDRDYSDYIDELRGRISARIEIDYYLNHLDIYVKERPYVLQLSEYLEKHQAELQVPISENERSFAIWKQEKFLSGRLESGVSAHDVLKHCNISRELLNIYKTAEPLAYYSHSKKTPQNILILENLDPFYGMRRYMLGGKDSICGITFGTLVYGGGKRVSRAFADFELLAEPYLTAGDNRFYYLGDIDYEGIGIYEGFAKQMQEIRTILPCVPFYLKMLDQVQDIEVLPLMKENQHRVILDEFLSRFSKEYQDKIVEILEVGRYVPQEILSVMDYEG